MLKHKYLGLFIKTIVFLHKSQNKLADLHVIDFIFKSYCVFTVKLKRVLKLWKEKLWIVIYFFSFYYDMINYAIIRAINEVRRDHS